MTTERQRYRAYMLRLWQIGGDDRLTWRVSLEDAHTGARQGFASLDALFTFLEENTGWGLSATTGRSCPGPETKPGPHSGE